MSDSSSIQAMQALSRAQRVTANNVANVNTDGFEPSRTHLEDGPGGEGVSVSAITKSNSGMPVYRREQTVVDESVRSAGSKPPSGTDVARETVDMIRNQRAFSANATMIRATEEMTGHLLNIIA